MDGEQRGVNSADCHSLLPLPTPVDLKLHNAMILPNCDYHIDVTLPNGDYHIERELPHELNDSVNINHLSHSSLYDIKLRNKPCTKIHKQHPIRRRRCFGNRTRPSKPSKDTLILRDSSCSPTTTVFQVSLNNFNATPLPDRNIVSDAIPEVHSLIDSDNVSSFDRQGPAPVH